MMTNDGLVEQILLSHPHTNNRLFFLLTIKIGIYLRKTSKSSLTLYSITTPFYTFEIYHVFENIMENGTFALLEQILNFP